MAFFTILAFLIGVPAGIFFWLSLLRLQGLAPTGRLRNFRRVSREVFLTLFWAILLFASIGSAFTAMVFNADHHDYQEFFNVLKPILVSIVVAFLAGIPAAHVLGKCSVRLPHTADTHYTRRLRDHARDALAFMLVLVCFASESVAVLLFAFIVLSSIVGDFRVGP